MFIPQSESLKHLAPSILDNLGVTANKPTNQPSCLFLHILSALYDVLHPFYKKPEGSSCRTSVPWKKFLSGSSIHLPLP